LRPSEYHTRTYPNAAWRFLSPRGRDGRHYLPTLRAPPSGDGIGLLHFPDPPGQSADDIRARGSPYRMARGGPGRGPFQRERDGFRREGGPAVHPGAWFVGPRPARWPRVRDPAQRVPTNAPRLRRASQRIRNGHPSRRPDRVSAADLGSSGTRIARAEPAGPRWQGGEGSTRHRRTWRNLGRNPGTDARINGKD